MSNLLNGWKKYFSNSPTTDSKTDKKPFPKDFFIGSNQVEFLATHFDQCDDIENIVVTEAVNTANYYKEVRGDETIEYPSIKWTNGLLILNYRGQLIEDNITAQVQKLITLEEKGYDIPQKYQHLINRTIGEKYIGKVFRKDQDPNQNSIYKILQFAGTPKNNPLFIIEVYPHDSYIKKTEIKLSFTKLKTAIKNNQLSQLNNDEYKQWELTAKSNDKTKAKIIHIFSLLPDNQDYKEEFSDSNRKPIILSNGKKVIPHQWSVIKTNQQNILRIYYQFYTICETKVLNIDKTNCIRYPKFIDLVFEATKDLELEKRISFLITTFGNKFEHDYILRFVPETEIEYNGILYDSVVTKDKGTIKVYNSETYKILPLVKIGRKRLLDNVLIVGNKLIKILLNKENKKYNQEILARIDEHKKYIYDHLIFLSKSKKQNISLEELWSEIYNSNDIDPVLLDRVAQATQKGIQSKEGNNNTSVEHEPNSSQEATDDNKNITQENKISKETTSKEVSTSEKAKEIQSPTEETQIVEKTEEKNTDTNNNTEEQNIFFSENTTSEVNVEEPYEKNVQNQSSEEQKEQEEKDYPENVSEYIEVNIKNKVSRWNNSFYLKQEVYRKYGNIIIERLQAQLHDNKLPWVNRVSGIPCNANGESFSGINAIMLTIWKELQGFKANIFLSIPEIKEIGLQVKYDAISIKIIVNDKILELFNIEQTNCLINNNRLYEEIVSNMIATNRTIESKYAELEAVAQAEERELNTDGVVNAPIYIHSKKVIKVASKDQYETIDDYYRDLGIATTEAVRKVDSAKLALIPMLKEDIISLLGSAMISQNCHFNATNASYIQLWEKWLSESPQFVEEILLAAESALMQSVKKEV